MRLPVVEGVIQRRILVNYRVDPEVMANVLPAPFRPQVIHGYGLAGICLIRLAGVRPLGLPAWMGISSENAAHRVAVQWDDQGVPREGVYVRRRDSNSWLNAWGGGRLFPGIHHHARFEVAETNEHFHVALRSDDGHTHMSVAGKTSDSLPQTSIFASLAEASAFFEAGSMGYSPASGAGRFQGLELRCTNWHAEPLAIEAVTSSFFDDRAVFPSDSIEFDCALLMRNIHHRWHSHEELCCTQPQPTTAAG